VAAAVESRGGAVSTPPIVRVFLAKHGEYYHPARVETDAVGGLLQWVVNVAVSSAGKSLLLKEYAILNRLNREFDISYLPQVYTASEVAAGRDRSVALFMGEWLAGFHEFHLTQDSWDSTPTLVLWDPENGRVRMATHQAAEIYHQVARILTHYFNLTTFEGIGDWHHAAGDFVVRLDGGQLEVRLVTVRDYRSLFRSHPKAGGQSPGFEIFLHALLVFLLNIGIRTRLDRLDGTGDMSWSDSVAVKATVAGMLASLSKKEIPFELPLPLDQIFRHYLAACSVDDLQDLCSDMASALGSTAPSIKAHLKEHVSELAHALRRV
jgi:hypothetical protein